MRSLKLSTLFLLFVLPTMLWAEPVTLEVFPNGRHGDVLDVRHVEMLKTTESVDFSSILSIDNGAWVKPRTNANVMLAINQDAWIRFKIVNRSQMPGLWVVQLRGHTLRAVEMAALSKDGFGEIKKGGLDVPLYQTEYTDSNIAFSVTLAPGENKWVYLRYGDNMVYSPIVVWPESEYEQHTNHHLIFFSITMGILMVMTLYNLSLYMFTKGVEYILYSTTVCGAAFYLLGVSGYGRLYVWGDSDFLNSLGLVVFASWCFISNTYFFRQFLQVSKYGGWLLHTNNVLIFAWVMITAACFTPFNGIAFGLTGPVGLLTVVAGTVSGIYLWLKGNPQAKYFCISWSVLSIATFIAISVLFSGMSYTMNTDLLQPVGFIVNVVMLSMALADRINTERREKELAQELALHRQTEMLEMQEKANQELEENVRKRTLELASVAADLERANEELAHSNRIDGLTEIYNRGHFDDVFQQEITRSVRNGSPMALILIDIDHFKSINDTYGHVVGDKCLKLIAKTLSHSVTRASDLLARYGGEEFAVILPDTSEANARIVAEKIRVSIESLAFICDGKQVPLSVSVGVAGRAMVEGDSPERFIAAVDESLYRAKNNGRNRVEVGLISFRNKKTENGSPSSEKKS